MVKRAATVAPTPNPPARPGERETNPPPAPPEPPPLLLRHCARRHRNHSGGRSAGGATSGSPATKPPISSKNSGNANGAGAPPRTRRPSPTRPGPRLLQNRLPRPPVSLPSPPVRSRPLSPGRETRSCRATVSPRRSVQGPQNHPWRNLLDCAMLGGVALARKFRTSLRSLGKNGRDCWNNIEPEWLWTSCLP